MIVSTAQSSYWRREGRGLVESHADPLLLTPHDVTGNVRTAALKTRLKCPEMACSAISSAAPEMEMSQIKQLIVLPAN
jgi:hypothetical protein